MKDNRNYCYQKNSQTHRAEYKIIQEIIPSNVSVIDLGCGDGSLLTLLKKKDITGEGIDISESAVKVAQTKGIKAKIGRIDEKLPYHDKEFDYAICSVTLQMVMYPEILLSEMKRIAKKLIVSFPNFAFLLNRIDLLLLGRMPKIMISGYNWYSTGHIHQLSVRDFEEFCRLLKLTIVKKYFFYPKPLKIIPKFILDIFPNLFSTTALFLLQEKK